MARAAGSEILKEAIKPPPRNFLSVPPGYKEGVDGSPELTNRGWTPSNQRGGEAPSAQDDPHMANIRRQHLSGAEAASTALAQPLGHGYEVPLKQAAALDVNARMPGLKVKSLSSFGDSPSPHDTAPFWGGLHEAAQEAHKFDLNLRRAAFAHEREMPFPSPGGHQVSYGGTPLHDATQINPFGSDALFTRGPGVHKSYTMRRTPFKGGGSAGSGYGRPGKKAARARGGAWWDDLRDKINDAGSKIKNEFVNPDSVLRQGVAKARNEISNPDSDLRSKIIPGAASIANLISPGAGDAVNNYAQQGLGLAGKASDAAASVGLGRPRRRSPHMAARNALVGRVMRQHHCSLGEASRLVKHMMSRS